MKNIRRGVQRGGWRWRWLEGWLISDFKTKKRWQSFGKLGRIRRELSLPDGFVIEHNKRVRSENDGVAVEFDAVISGSIGEALRGKDFGDFWKCRVGDWRINADLDDGVLLITVIRIGKRSDVYRR